MSNARIYATIGRAIRSAKSSNYILHKIYICTPIFLIFFFLRKNLFIAPKYDLNTRTSGVRVKLRLRRSLI